MRVNLLVGGGNCQADSVSSFHSLSLSDPWKLGEEGSFTLEFCSFITDEMDLRDSEQLTENCTAKRDRGQMKRTSFFWWKALVFSIVTVEVVG